MLFTSPHCPLQLQCLQKSVGEAQSQTQVPGISHSSKIHAGLEVPGVCCTLGMWTKWFLLVCFQDRRALCKAALIMGQKRLSDRTGMQKTSSNSASLTDYNQLGFNLRSNIFQGEGTNLCVTYKAGSIYTLPGLTAATLLLVEIWL